MARQIDGSIGRWMGRCTDRWIGGQPDTWTYMNIYIHMYIYITYTDGTKNRLD